MKNFLKLLLALIIGLLLGSILGLGYFYYKEIRYFRAAAWVTAPIVVDCTYGALSKIRLQSAVDFWSEYEHHIAFVELDPSIRICAQDHVYGFIIIKNSNLPWPVLGETTRMGDAKSNISSALIELSMGSANEPRLLEHELGHAFGYRHLNIKGHIMHSDYDSSGWDFWDNSSN